MLKGTAESCQGTQHGKVERIGSKEATALPLQDLEVHRRGDLDSSLPDVVGNREQ
jgi:hypothetical protein